MHITRFLTLSLLVLSILGPVFAQDLKPLPKLTDPAPLTPQASQPAEPPVSEPVSVDAAPSSGLGKNYWLMANGSPVGYKIDVKVNGNPVGSVRGTEQALDVTSHLKAGVNTVSLNQTETGAKGSGSLAVTIGPEMSREGRGPNQTYINLKESLVHFVRPAGNRGGGGEVTLHIPVGETPNAELTQRYILYSQGEISGHKIAVSLNGLPLIDIASPGAYCDLNPFLKPGENEFAFSSEKVPGFAFSAGERSALEGKDFEVGVAVVGDYDPSTYSTPVRQLTTVVLRYTQPAGQDEPEIAETLTLLAE